MILFCDSRGGEEEAVAKTESRMEVGYRRVSVNPLHIEPICDPRDDELLANLWRRIHEVRLEGEEVRASCDLSGHVRIEGTVRPRELLSGLCRMARHGAGNMRNLFETLLAYPFDRLARGCVHDAGPQLRFVIAEDFVQTEEPEILDTSADGSERVVVTIKATCRIERAPIGVMVYVSGVPSNHSMCTWANQRIRGRMQARIVQLLSAEAITPQA